MHTDTTDWPTPNNTGQMKTNHKVAIMAGTGLSGVAPEQDLVFFDDDVSFNVGEFDISPATTTTSYMDDSFR